MSMSSSVLLSMDSADGKCNRAQIGGHMFSLKDICEIAIKIEKNGEKVYRNAQMEVKDPELKKLLGWMADEEAKHANWFENLSKNFNFPVQHPQIEALGKSLLEDSVGSQSFSLSENKLIKEASFNWVIDQSIEFEKDTIIFYEMLREFIGDNEILKQLELIISEEQRHINKLSMLNNA